LMGTLLAITLYAVTVRSSLVLRLGVIENGIENDAVSDDKKTGHFKQLIDDIRAVFKKRHMRLEVVPYATSQALQREKIEKEVHATCSPQEQLEKSGEVQPYNTTIRVRRVYEIMETELASPGTTLTYVNTPEIEEKH